MDIVNSLYDVLEFLHNLYISWVELKLVGYAYHECEGWCYTLVVFWLLWCQSLAYSVWWNGRDCVGVGVLVTWEFLWCLIFVVDY